jgi:hypothetical protein
VTKRSRLRRARRVVAGGLVGGAVVMARRHRRRDPLAPLPGHDPLAAFADAPCFREATVAAAAKTPAP